MGAKGWAGVAIFLAVGGCGDSDEGPAKNVGEPCTPGVESKPGFSGFGLEEVSVEGENPACGRGVCLINHFQGGVSCPYGQSDPSDPRCFLPNSEQPVTLPVEPQKADRRGELAVTCSCRCDGPDDGPFCLCPRDTKCLPVVPDLGFPEGKSIAGSYCIAPHASYVGFAAGECDIAIENCGPP